MTFRKNVKNSLIFTENDDYFRKEWFSFKDKKYLHNIDSFYYTVSIENDSNDNPAVIPLIDELSELRARYIETRELVGLNDKLFVCSGVVDDIYGFRLTCPEKYDIFLTSYLPNPKTPRIIVQCRSAALWLDGVKDVIEDSFYQLSKVIGHYDLKVSRVYENRIDYCYHTNYIQDMYTYFSDKKLDNQLRGRLTDWQKLGRRIRNKHYLDYYALGHRKSNNVFVRIYHKSKEVIDENYKGFFIEEWFKQGLISAYDKYVYQYAYEKENYNSIFEGMLKFYVDYGKDQSYIDKCNKFLKSDTDINFYRVRDLALEICPEPTTIVNIEFQTKRKFYYYSDDFINDFTQKIRTLALSRLMKIIDNRKMFLDYITHEDIRFIDSNNEYKDWWRRLRNLKMDSLDVDREYARKYQYSLDQKKVQKQLVNKLATNSVYKLDLDTDFVEDVVDLICSLNDNDIKRENLKIINTLYGDIVDSIDAKYLNDYKKKKEKKYKSIKNRLMPKDED